MVVVGAGLGGGVIADQLSDLGVDVLVLEAGSYLFPTHVGNLPRQHQLARFDKHVWGFWDDFQVINYQNAPGSQFAGGQAFNLGGRSIFWGGFAPRMTPWELAAWPSSVREYLEQRGYRRAEEVTKARALPSSPYQEEIKALLRQVVPDFDHFDAPVAVQYTGFTRAALPFGIFSTADLLLGSRLTAGASGNKRLTINLNHAVTRVETSGSKATEVVAHDLIANSYRTFRGKSVVLAGGTIESAKLAKLSGAVDPNQRIGVGITDHPNILYAFRDPDRRAAS